jgi:hypothetical protein
VTRLLAPLFFAAALACLFLGFAELRTAEGPVGQQSGWDRLLGRVPDLSAWATGEVAVDEEPTPEAAPPAAADESPADRARRLLREQADGAPDPAPPPAEGPGVPLDLWLVCAVLCALAGAFCAVLRHAWVPVAWAAGGIVGAGALAIGHWQWATRLAEEGLPAWRIDPGVVEALPATGLWGGGGFFGGGGRGGPCAPAAARTSVHHLTCGAHTVGPAATSRSARCACRPSAARSAEGPCVLRTSA